MVHNWAVHKGDSITIDGKLIFHINNVLEFKGIIKPILRPLSDMTEEEILEVAKITNCLPIRWQENYKVVKPENPNEGIEIRCGSYSVRVTFKGCIYFHDYTKPNAAIYLPKTPDIIRCLLSKHFDLFGLIESGLAVDKTKLQTP